MMLSPPKILTFPLESPCIKHDYNVPMAVKIHTVHGTVHQTCLDTMIYKVFYNEHKYWDLSCYNATSALALWDCGCYLCDFGWTVWAV